MRNPIFRALLGLFFLANGVLFAIRAVWRGDGWYWGVAAIWAVAATLLLAGVLVERGSARR